MTALHRIQEVRQRQGHTIRTMARQLGVTAAQYQGYESPSCDMRLTDLYRLAEVIGCPPEELLRGNECDEVTKLRGFVVRVARIANSLLAHAPNSQVETLSQSLRNAVLDVMPGLDHQHGLIEVGKRRSTDEMGRIAENVIEVGRWLGDASNEALLHNS